VTHPVASGRHSTVGHGGVGASGHAAVALGGAAGTVLRLLATAPILSVAADPGPWRLVAVNVAGAGALGLVLARREHSAAVRRWWPFLATGFLGGLTTFSSMVVAAGRLGHDLGLVAPGSMRMTPAGLGLSAAYLAASIALGLIAFRLGQRVGAGPEPAAAGESAPA
jgi:CrcB protein